MSHDKKPSEVNQNSVANDNGNRFKPLDVNDIRLKEVSGEVKEQIISEYAAHQYLERALIRGRLSNKDKDKKTIPTQKVDFQYVPKQAISENNQDK